MGRYAGEDYELGPPCAPGRHNFAPNGNCWTCRQNKDSLIAQPDGKSSKGLCGKLGCDKEAVGEAHGGLLYSACAEHLPEIKALVDGE